VIGGTNCIGSLAAGWLGARYPKHILLGLLYILRAIVFTAYFVMPPTPASDTALPEPKRGYLVSFPRSPDGLGLCQLL
jgi:hypothetical protein